MRHLKRTAKLGRTSKHRNAMLANLVCSLIRHKRITTTLAKAKAVRPVAEKMVTFGKRGTMRDRRMVAARLRYNEIRMHASKELGAKARKTDVIRILFEEIAPTFKTRPGGYTRIVKLNQRQGDAADLAILEWVEMPAEAAATTAPAATPAPTSEAPKLAEGKAPETPAP